MIYKRKHAYYYWTGMILWLFIIIISFIALLFFRKEIAWNGILASFLFLFVGICMLYKQTRTIEISDQKIILHYLFNKKQEIHAVKCMVIKRVLYRGIHFFLFMHTEKGEIRIQDIEHFEPHLLTVLENITNHSIEGKELLIGGDGTKSPEATTEFHEQR